MAGAGSIPFGSGPAGASLSLGPFDVFSFTEGSTSTLLAQVYTNTSGSVGPDPAATGYIELIGTSTEAFLFVDKPVNDQFTVEWTIKTLRLPTDFTRPLEDYLVLGMENSAGTIASLWLSRAGIGYGYGVGSAFDVLAGSQELVDEESFWTIRLAGDAYSGNVYLYVTKTDEVARTGHRLRFVLSGLDISRSPVSSGEGVFVRSTGTARSTDALLAGFSLSTEFLIPNLPPVADAGNDQSVRQCSIVQLDGSASFDPEGAPLLYGWRLIDAPETSQYTSTGVDGSTPVGVSFTDRFYSPSFGVLAITTGQVLIVNGEPHSIFGTGSDGFGTYVRVTVPAIPVGLVDAAWKIFQQNGLSEPDQKVARFYPDKPGFYRFDLAVYDGELVSEASTTVLNVVESLVPRGITPNLSFMWDYLSSFWSLIDDRGRIETVWSATAQIVASELLNLWQIDYAKSLKNIQRLFQRRWLHYDTKVSESFPELSVIKKIRKPIDSRDIPLAGSPLVGLSFTLSWTGGSKTVTFTGSDPLTAAQALIQINTALVGTGITAQLVEHRVVAGSKFVRLTAQKVVTVSASTTTLFTVGQTTEGVLSGIDAHPLRPNTLRVTNSLLGLGLAEDDLIESDGTLYRVVRIVDVATDDYQYSRVVVKEGIPLTAGGGWSVPSHITSSSIDFWSGLVSSGDTLELEVVDDLGGQTVVSASALGACEGKPKRVAFDPTGVVALDSDSSVWLLSASRRQYIPIDSLVSDIPYLQAQIVNAPEEEVLRRNVDFWLKEFRGQKAISFDPRVWQDANNVLDVSIPERLWAETTYLDNRPTIEGNFGRPAEFLIEDAEAISSNFDYLSAVRGLWFAYLQGPVIENLRVGTQILLGLPFAEQAGTIEEIRTDFSPNEGRILIRDSDSGLVRSYQFPRVLPLATNPATGAVYAEGDSVSVFAPLVDGVEVVDYIKDPKWFAGLLDRGLMVEVEKFFTFMVRVDSAAFNLTSLALVQNFIRRIKPTYTFGVFVVRKVVDETDINVTEEFSQVVRLELFDSPCADAIGSTPMFDEPRAGGAPIGSVLDGGLRWRNRFDEDNDPDNAAPTPPTPDTVEWGFDALYLCPEETILATICEDFTGLDPFTGLPWGPTFYPPHDSIFVYDDPVYLESDVTFSTPISWDFDTTLPADVYCSRRTLAPS